MWLFERVYSISQLAQPKPEGIELHLLVEFRVMLDRQFDEYLNVAVTSRAPNEIIDGLKNRTDAPTFISEADYNLSAREWRHITQTFEKKGEYYFVLINQST